MREDYTAGDIAWAAGLFEGEGCISVYRDKARKDKLQISLRLAMSDSDVIDRFAAIVGCGSVRRDVHNKRRLENPATGHWKPIDNWSVYEAARVREILRAFMPWFGERRHAKAEEALAAGAHIVPIGHQRTHCPQGHPLSGDNVDWDKSTRVSGEVVPIRRCRTCRRKQGRERMRARRAAERVVA